MIERGPALAARRIDGHEFFRAIRKVVAVPKTRVVAEPIGFEPRFIHALHSKAATSPLLRSLRLVVFRKRFVVVENGGVIRVLQQRIIGHRIESVRIQDDER